MSNLSAKRTCWHVSVSCDRCQVGLFSGLATPWGCGTSNETQTGACFGTQSLVPAQDVTLGSDRMWIHQVMFRVFPIRQRHDRVLVVVARQLGLFVEKENKTPPQSKYIKKKKATSRK